MGKIAERRWWETFVGGAASALLLGAGIFASLPALAATKEIFVSPFGSDTPTCGAITAACKTLEHATDLADYSDTVFLTYPADYGPATIGKSVTIQGVEGAGVFSPPGVPCLTINGDEDTRVMLSEFTCDQGGAANHGILFNSGRDLSMSNVVIRNGGGDKCGIKFNAVEAEHDHFLGGERVWVSGFGATGFSGGICILSEGILGSVRASMDDFDLNANRYGLLMQGSSKVLLLVNHSIVRGNTVGIFSRAALSKVTFLRSMIVSNGTGLKRTAGEFISTGGNTVRENGVDGSFTSVIGTR